jgi:hypothetical protein
MLLPTTCFLPPSLCMRLAARMQAHSMQALATPSTALPAVDCTAGRGYSNPRSCMHGKVVDMAAAHARGQAVE